MKPADQKNSMLFAFACVLSLNGCGGGGGSSNVAPPAVVGSPTPKLSSTPIVLNGAALGTASWADGSTASGGHGAVMDNVGCAGTVNMHNHAHLAIFRNGEMLALPAQVGLQGCTYELHTHDRSGVIHVESAADKVFTLGQFFSVWGESLLTTNIADITGLPVTVFIDDDGKSITVYTGSLADIELKPHRSITILIGSAPTEIPSYSWGSL